MEDQAETDKTPQEYETGELQLDSIEDKSLEMCLYFKKIIS